MGVRDTHYVEMRKHILVPCERGICMCSGDNRVGKDDKSIKIKSSGIAITIVIPIVIPIVITIVIPIVIAIVIPIANSIV